MQIPSNKNPANKLNLNSNFKCKSTNPITRMCTNPKCEQQILICNAETCRSCTPRHNFCSSLKLSAFTTLIQQRTSEHSDFLSCLFQIEDQLIEAITLNRQKMLQRYGMADLDFKDRQLVDKIYKEQGKGLYGKDIDSFHKRLMQNVNNRSKKYKGLLQNYKEESLKFMKELMRAKQKLLNDFEIQKNKAVFKPFFIKNFNEKLYEKPTIKEESSSLSHHMFSSPPEEQQNRPYVKQEAIQIDDNEQDSRFGDERIPDKHQIIKKQRKPKQARDPPKHKTSSWRSNILIKNLIQQPKGDQESERQTNMTKNIVISKILQRISKEQMDFIKASIDNPKELHLLFIASDHQFSSAKFHQICNDIPNTLTIVHTKNGRIIAGFTPIPWSSASKHNADLSNKTCLLSISGQAKLVMTDNKYATYSYPTLGPSFGAALDLAISDHCDVNLSEGYFPTYFNYAEKAIISNQNSWTAFSGVKNGHRFLVKEYEVYQVIY